MEILVLGDSNTEGTGSAGIGWPDLLKASLEERLGQPVTLRSTRLWVVGPDAAEVAAKRIEQSHPDIVILAVGAYAFTAKYVYLRMKHLFGDRASNWYKSMEVGFDQRTGGARSGGRVNRFARSAIRRTIGTAPFASRKNVTEGYRAVFSTLARSESIEVIAMTYPGRASHALSDEAKKERALFFPEIRKAAESHRFGWVDGADMFAGVAKVEGLYTDGLHFDDGGQAIFARAMEAAVLERIARHA